MIFNLTIINIVNQAAKQPFCNTFTREQVSGAKRHERREREKSMGVTESRERPLPDDIDSKYHIYKKNWTADNIGSDEINGSRKGRSTLGKEVLSLAASHITDYLILNNISTVRILEPFAGNGVATNVIYKKLTELKLKDFVIKSTDIQNLSQYVDESSYPVEFGLNSVETIEKYQFDDFNILMMISPPPMFMIKEMSNYADYFAIKQWARVSTAKLVIFIGELGASDGSIGLYSYMMNNKLWQLDYRTMIENGNTITGPYEKELFIFKKYKIN